MGRRVYFRVGIGMLFSMFCAQMASAARTITQGPWVSNVTRSTALISWVTDQASSSTVRWGFSPGFYPYTGTGALTSMVHSWYLSGAPGNSTIYYVACSGANGGFETCSPEMNFRTLAQAVIPA